MQVDSFFWNLLRLDPHKVIVRRHAFKSFPNAWNGVESKDGLKVKSLKCQFSQVKGDLNLQKIPKSIPIPKKNTIEKDDCDERQKFKH
jgi:hypothetical protein